MYSKFCQGKAGALKLWIIFTILFSSVLAMEVQLDQSSSLFKRLEIKGQIHHDRREPPTKRQNPTSTLAYTSSYSSTSAEASIISQSATKISSSVPSIVVVTTPLPSPFDTFLGSNFTEPSCPAYFTKFLSNSTFQSCVPISLLLRNSVSFFQAERSSTLLSETLDAACNATLISCTQTLSDVASQLISDSNCGKDYELQNPLVTQAYAGLISYEPIYRATCLKSPDSGEYCFSEAVSNVNNAADTYPYFTALGMNLPTSAKPTCNKCLHHTMQIFASFAKMSQQPLSGTYLGCANQVDSTCGAGYADINVKVGSIAAPNTASIRSASVPLMGSMVLIMIWAGLT